MRKKRILWVNEPSWRSTGYSVYGKEVLSRLSQIEGLEVAELACYATQKEANENTTNWPIYGNRPDDGSPELAAHLANPVRLFGKEIFAEACLNFRPDFVMDIRDHWMFEFQQRSPFRDFYNWAIMPTVDAMPQRTDWIHTFGTADAVFSYSEFGRDTMLSQSDNINFIDIASPAASEDYHPITTKSEHRDSMGIDSDAFIIGTVMRNQRRKLYPDLFKSFRMLLDRTNNPNVFLYCHKYYPDIGWETPQLLDKFGLNNRVLFSYKCTECGHISVDFYKDGLSHCTNCGKITKRMVGLNNSMNEEEMNKVYNLFNIYVQYANSEGFGMPQLEAAYAGVPIISVDYSAMSSVVKNLGAYPLKPLALSMECETGCYRAVPDNAGLVDMLRVAIEQRSGLLPKGIQTANRAREIYSWDKTADVWAKYFLSTDVRDHSETWMSPLDIHDPADTMPLEIKSIPDQVNYMFTHVLGKPEWIGGHYWSHLVKGLNFGVRVKSQDPDFYFNESHINSQDKFEVFNLRKAYEDMVALRNNINQYEVARGKFLGITKRK